MERIPFSVPAQPGHLGGWRAGSGAPVLLLHGGPGLSFSYLDALALELADDYEVAFFQQRGLEPSTTQGPFTVAQAVTDVVAVLDGIGWQSAWVVGHSWGGHLAFHVAAAAPERVRGVLSIDPLGGTGDGGAAEFNEAIAERALPEHRDRLRELNEIDDADSTAELQDELMRLAWPSYFATRDAAPPMPPLQFSLPAGAGLFPDLARVLPELEAALPGIGVPVAVFIGAGSPMPPESAGLATAAAIPGAWSHVEADAGHFPWLDHPGCVNPALDRLTGRAPV